MKTIVLSIVVGLWTAGVATAGDCCTAPTCCDDANQCCCDCGKDCKIVCGTKQVKKTVWVVECKEFCVPMPGCKHDCCGRQACCCQEEDCCCDPCASLRKPMVPPRCGKVRCKKKLVKKTIVCEIPIYKCEPGCCGDGCCDPCGCGEE